MTKTYIILGGGVIGFTTALQLRDRFPHASIILVARYLPGDRDIQYASPWAGANWLSGATDNGRQEEWDRVTYERFRQLSREGEQAGVQSMGIHAIYDSPPEDAGVLSQGTNEIWYARLGNLKPIPDEDLPAGSKFGYDLDTFVIDTQRYLAWLQSQAASNNIQIRRGIFQSIDELFSTYPEASAYFNCSGLGSYFLKRVEDKSVYPTRGQVMLVESPKTPLKRMYFRSPRREDNDITYVFPRGAHGQGGVILGGCRLDNVWDEEVDLKFAEDIKRRCCALAPELGRPEDLKVIYHGVGLRPSRKGGVRLEKQWYGNSLVIHNYGAGGTGYQASWGMAKEAVSLLEVDSRL